jgi:hypothetical protein
MWKFLIELVRILGRPSSRVVDVLYLALGLALLSYSVKLLL